MNLKLIKSGKLIRAGYSNTMLAYYIEYRKDGERKIEYFDTIKQRNKWINKTKIKGFNYEK